MIKMKAFSFNLVLRTLMDIEEDLATLSYCLPHNNS